MASASSRLRTILGHLLPTSASVPSEDFDHTHNFHALNPTFFLERAATIEPNAEAIYHVTANNQVLRRSYAEAADRARGFAHFLAKHNYKRVGILAPNTPAFLECIFAIPAAGAVIVPVNYRLDAADVSYILDFAGVDSIVVDAEYESLLTGFRETHPKVRVLVDTDTDASEGQLCGPFDEAVLEGLDHDAETGSHGWSALKARCGGEEDMIAIPFTSGTTSKPKGVVYTARGCYLAALGNVIESGLNAVEDGRCRYLWTLPMFHAMGWTLPWGITAVRGTHYCLRRIDYPTIWKLLREEAITHFNAAPTVNTLLCAAEEAGRLPKPVRVTVAASPPPASLLERMESLNLLPVHVYGMTETYGPITKGYIMPEWDRLPQGERFARMSRQGHGFVTSLPVRVVRRQEDEEEGREGGEGSGGEAGAQTKLEDVRADGKEIGEVIFLGNICAKEYYRDPEATRKLFAGGGLHSGDLAVKHPDGSVQVLDRSKDIIISGGENISSVALEALLAEHPDVLEVGVVSVPDSHWGERPKAYVTTRSGKEISGREVVEWARQRKGISRFMVPREVEIIAEFPKTSTGKIRKNVLRDWARGHA